ncbi:hypothetical protein H8F21_15705 [Pseudomonas sp. P66]|uniref:Uncharacterized protein n=1 Tax=Pseudomonas arcuscaelestis TaxID=2710591 RepID=A0ABS2BZF6_9PSED|nr:hypothetical protein [Pseudomonas arcuscaelestis]MBM5459013.1 hypothetical protein [Pseudomonas arcuscaelestis]
MTKLRVLAAMGLLLCGAAQAGQNISIPVEVIDVKREQTKPAEWVRFEGLSSGKASKVVSDAKAQGADCHEFSGKVLVCRFPEVEPKQAGVDFSSVKDALDGL